MSVTLQIILISASVLMFIYMMRKIRKSQLNIDDSIFWIFFAVGLFIMSVFPIIPDFFSKVIGIGSTVNFIFLMVIFVLLLKLFLLTIKISRLEKKIKSLVQKIGIKDIKNSDSKQKKV